MSVSSSIGIRTLQIEPYTGKAVGVEVPQGNNSQFYNVVTNGSELTNNRSAWELFEAMQAHCQAFTFSDAALQPMMTKDLIEDALKRIQICFAETSVRVQTHTNRIFGSVFGGPPAYEFQKWPLRWSGENHRALTISQAFVACCYQIPRLRSNALDQGIVDNQAATVIRPLFDIKAEIMRMHFGLEIQGEVSPDELDALLSGVNLLKTRPASDDQRRESQAQLLDRQTQAMAQESLARPTVEAIETAMSGIDVWTWTPKAADWATFAALLKEREMTSIQDPPGIPFPFSTVIGSGGAGAATAGLTAGPGAGTVIPSP